MLSDDRGQHQPRRAKVAFLGQDPALMQPNSEERLRAVMKKSHDLTFPEVLDNTSCAIFQRRCRTIVSTEAVKASHLSKYILPPDARLTYAFLT